MAGRVAKAFRTGKPSAGTMLSDIFLFGDIRDVVVEGMHYLRASLESS